MLDRVYAIEWLEDITTEEKEYAKGIMKKMNFDMKYPTQQEQPYTFDVIMNNIIFFKRIANELNMEE